MNRSADPPAIILFDGVCNLCNAFVNFVIARDPAGRFRFGALQSPEGREALRRSGASDEGLRTLVLIEDGRAYTESTAALRVLRGLSPPWPLLSALRVVPPLLRDPVYRFVARHRYRWFGQRAHCRLPDPGLERRFLK